jgi:membrane-associated progesterone receptor component
MSALANPLNLALSAILLYLARNLVRPFLARTPTLSAARASPSSYLSLPASHPHKVEWRVFTPHTLAPFDGTAADARILLAIDGSVFDVSRGANFYGPSGPYGNFAGRDASRGMAKQSFEMEMLAPLDARIDDLQDLTPAER